ncbi:MAG: hypothetical protein Aureis2KO_08050 [Aureisphaera sp.]
MATYQIQDRWQEFGSSFIKWIYLILVTTFILGCENQNSGKTISTQQSTFYDLTNKLQSGYYPNFHSVIIYSKGDLVYEKYLSGKDEVLGKNVGVVQHSQNSLHDIRSITKSIVSTCVGIAIDQGLLKSVDQKISSFFPEFHSILINEKEDWTVRHFLTMTTGFDWNEDVPYTDPSNDETIMMFNDTPIEYVLSRPLIHSPGTMFNYSGGATQILVEIIERASGMTIDDFATNYLFKKIQIDKHEWLKFEKSNIYAGPSGLRLTSRGLLNYAILYLNKGKWEGNQIISANWIDSSFSKQIEFPSDALDWNEYYGYQFWIWHDLINKTRTNIVSANGNGDQNIFWDLNSNLVVITTAGNYNNWEIEKDAYHMLKNEIYLVLK